MTTLDSALIQPEQTAPPRPSILGLFFGIIARPRRTLAYLRDHGGQSWIYPALLAIVITIGSRLIIAPIQAAEFEARLAEIEQNGGIVRFEEAAPAQGSESGEGEGNFVVGPGGGGGTVTVVAGGPVGASSTNQALSFGLTAAGLVLGWVLRGGLIFLLAALLGGKGSLGAVARMGVWTSIPDIVRTLIITLTSVATGRVAVSGLAFMNQAIAAPPGGAVMTWSSGPGGFTGPSFSFLFVNQLLAQLDIYTIWSLALLIIGVAITARLPWFKALAVVLVFWAASLVLGVVPSLLGSTLGQLLGGGGGPVGPGVRIGR